MRTHEVICNYFLVSFLQTESLDEEQVTSKSSFFTAGITQTMDFWPFIPCSAVFVPTFRRNVPPPTLRRINLVPLKRVSVQAACHLYRMFSWNLPHYFQISKFARWDISLVYGPEDRVREADSSPVSSVKVKNVRSWIFTPTYTFMACTEIILICFFV